MSSKRHVFTNKYRQTKIKNVKTKLANVLKAKKYKKTFQHY